MKKSICLLFLISAFSVQYWSQQELIANGGFEDHEQCPNTLGQFYVSDWFGTHGDRTTPDLFSTCAADEAYCSPGSYIINVVPFAGESYSGFVGYNPHNHYREYVSTRLKAPLLKGVEYEFSVSISQPKMALYYINELGVIFTKDSAKPEELPLELVAPAHLRIQNGEFLKLNDVWRTIKVSYTAKGGERYLHLGCFLSDEELLYRKYQERIAFSKKTGYKDAYYIIDNVSLQPRQEVVQDQPTKTFVFDNINFDSGDFSSSEEEFKQFEDLIAYLKINPGVKVVIEGHTDDVGEERDNQILSEERALFVKSFFEYQKVVNPISTVGYGESQPVVANDSQKNRALNRRVVIHLFGGD